MQVDIGFAQGFSGERHLEGPSGVIVIHTYRNIRNNLYTYIITGRCLRVSDLGCRSLFLRAWRGMAQVAQFALRKWLWQAGTAGQTKHGPDSPVHVEKEGLRGRQAGQTKCAAPGYQEPVDGEAWRKGV